MQQYTEIPDGHTLQQSLAELLGNDKTVMSNSSGTAFPTVNLQEGMLCWRADSKKLYQLEAITPLTWRLLLDLSGADAKVATAGAADSATDATNASNVAITDDGATNAVMFPLFGSATSGNGGVKVASTKLTFNPNTGTLSASAFAGAGTGLTGTASSLTAGAVTNGVYITGDQSIAGSKTFTDRNTMFGGSLAAGFAGGGYPAIGYNITYTATTDSYQRIVADACSIVQFYQGGMRFMGAGTGAAGSASGMGQLALLDVSGNLTATGNVTGYSDIRLKTDLTAIAEPLDKVMHLTGYTYTRKDSGRRDTGLVAQDVQKVLPEAVHEGEFLSLAYGNLVGLLVEAIKELNGKVERLSAKVA